MKVITGGHDNEVSNVTLNNSTYTEVTLPSGIARASSALIKSRDDSIDILYKRRNTDTPYFTIPAGLSLELNVEIDDNESFWLKSASGSPVAEIIWAT